MHTPSPLSLSYTFTVVVPLLLLFFLTLCLSVLLLLGHSLGMTVFYGIVFLSFFFYEIHAYWRSLNSRLVFDGHLWFMVDQQEQYSQTLIDKAWMFGTCLLVVKLKPINGDVTRWLYFAQDNCSLTEYCALSRLLQRT